MHILPQQGAQTKSLATKAKSLYSTIFKKSPLSFQDSNNLMDDPKYWKYDEWKKTEAQRKRDQVDKNTRAEDQCTMGDNQNSSAKQEQTFNVHGNSIFSRFAYKILKYYNNQNIQGNQIIKVNQTSQTTVYNFQVAQIKVKTHMNSNPIINFDLERARIFRNYLEQIGTRDTNGYRKIDYKQNQKIANTNFRYNFGPAKSKFEGSSQFTGYDYEKQQRRRFIHKRYHQILQAQQQKFKREKKQNRDSIINIKGQFNEKEQKKHKKIGILYKSLYQKRSNEGMKSSYNRLIKSQPNLLLAQEHSFQMSNEYIEHQKRYKECLKLYSQIVNKLMELYISRYQYEDILYGVKIQMQVNQENETDLFYSKQVQQVVYQQLKETVLELLFYYVQHKYVNQGRCNNENVYFLLMKIAQNKIKIFKQQSLNKKISKQQKLRQFLIEQKGRLQKLNQIQKQHKTQTEKQKRLKIQKQRQASKLKKQKETESLILNKKDIDDRKDSQYVKKRQERMRQIQVYANKLGITKNVGEQKRASEITQNRILKLQNQQLKYQNQIVSINDKSYSQRYDFDFQSNFKDNFLSASKQLSPELLLAIRNQVSTVLHNYQYKNIIYIIQYHINNYQYVSRIQDQRRLHSQNKNINQPDVNKVYTLKNRNDKKYQHTQVVESTVKKQHKENQSFQSKSGQLKTQCKKGYKNRKLYNLLVADSLDSNELNRKIYEVQKNQQRQAKLADQLQRKQINFIQKEYASHFCQDTNNKNYKDNKQMLDLIFEVYQDPDCWQQRQQWIDDYQQPQLQNQENQKFRQQNLRLCLREKVNKFCQNKGSDSIKAVNQQKSQQKQQNLYIYQQNQLQNVQKNDKYFIAQDKKKNTQTEVNRQKTPTINIIQRHEKVPTTQNNIRSVQSQPINPFLGKSGSKNFSLKNIIEGKITIQGKSGNGNGSGSESDGNGNGSGNAGANFSQFNVDERGMREMGFNFGTGTHHDYMQFGNQSKTTQNLNSQFQQRSNKLKTPTTNINLKPQQLNSNSLFSDHLNPISSGQSKKNLFDINPSFMNNSMFGEFNYNQSLNNHQPLQSMTNEYKVNQFQFSQPASSNISSPSAAVASMFGNTLSSNNSRQPMLFSQPERTSKKDNRHNRRKNTSRRIS